MTTKYDMAIKSVPNFTNHRELSDLRRAYIERIQDSQADSVISDFIEWVFDKETYGEGDCNE